MLFSSSPAYRAFFSFPQCVQPLRLLTAITPCRLFAAWTILKGLARTTRPTW